ncbi:3-hydroxyacyl-CoA dehydrogenase NAD-binding domain-containing protein [Nocardia sp. NPDC049737]|uniref:3-hydroxyacyl-CoA dehydrogenase NAD-binding domain-containing protein n=1 Tax=Nocardia sp. NPDC049737 TaxID=3154358 RepID=UPI00344AF6BA
MKTAQRRRPLADWRRHFPEFHSEVSHLDRTPRGHSPHRPGAHFFAPAHATKVVEIVRAALSDSDALATAAGLARSLRKTHRRRW